MLILKIIKKIKNKYYFDVFPRKNTLKNNIYLDLKYPFVF